MTSSFINNNRVSLIAQNNLYKTSRNLNTSLERLSSGLRINSAADDAAGLQISNRLGLQIGGLTEAIRNANNGLSIAQTAEGALQESTNIIQRIRDLAVQSANGSNSNLDREALQSEVSQLQSELNNIANYTSFGGKNLLNGSFGSSLFQVGSGANQTIPLSIGSTRASDLGGNNYDLDGSALSRVASATDTVAASSNAVAADSDLVISGQLGSATIAIQSNDTASDIAARINAQEDNTGVSADARTVVRLSSFEDSSTISFNLYGENASAVTISSSLTTSLDLSDLAAAINDSTGSTGIIAIANGSNLDLISENGDDIKIENFSSTGASGTVEVSSRNYDNSGAGTGDQTSQTIGAATTTDSTLISGSVRVTGGDGGFTFQNAAATTASTASGASTLTTVSNIDVSTAEGAQAAISIAEGALKGIDSIRANLGSVQNRFDFSIANLGNISANVTAARSRIVDADFALETTLLTKNQILQKAAFSVLAQANTNAQSVLSLLNTNAAN